MVNKIAENHNGLNRQGQPENDDWKNFYPVPVHSLKWLTNAEYPIINTGKEISCRPLPAFAGKRSMNLK
ncbi:MAG: hypothetical protein C4522_15015 [Desulfobacteraceae bacterium]|nr:MAG: hypothetical protein C4522_15015 [Desulfobacteraceae bacterium]